MASLTQISTGIGTATRSGPLSALTNKLLGASTLLYPADLGSSTKNHYVKFTIKQIDTSSFVSSQGVVNELIKTGVDLFSGHSFNAPTITIKDFIALYMPDTLNASYSADYGTLSITNSLGAGVTAGQYATAITDSNADTGKNSGQITATEAAVRSAGLLLASSLSQGIVSQDAAPVSLQSKGIAVNPQLQMIFQGVGFRHFQLAFTFTPSSQAEAETVASIISTFKYHFAPDILSATSARDGLFFVPPSYFNIEFMFNSTENQYLPKYGDCVLDSIDVNYAPNGFAAHIDGAPVQTQLMLSFKEIEIVTKSKLQSDYNSNINTSTVNGSGGLR
jgi:hypothetical protein